MPGFNLPNILTKTPEPELTSPLKRRLQWGMSNVTSQLLPSQGVMAPPWRTDSELIMRIPRVYTRVVHVVTCLNRACIMISQQRDKGLVRESVGL